jgi:hypothetical protein
MSPCNDPNFLAARARWDRRSKPPSDRRDLLPYERAFNLDEAERLAWGLIPQDMDDKWFIILRAGSLDFYRSWTGLHIYRLTITQMEAGLVAGPLLVDGERPPHPHYPDEWHINFVNRLIDRVLAQPHFG